VSNELVYLLNGDLNVLFVNGQNCLEYNAAGTLTALSRLHWKFQDQFHAANATFWKVNGKDTGVIRKHEKLTSLVVFDVGENLEFEHSDFAFEMFDKWINNKPWNNDTLVPPTPDPKKKL